MVYVPQSSGEWPRRFPNACLAVSVTTQAPFSDSRIQTWFALTAKSAIGCTIYRRGGGADIKANIIAIGY